MLKPLSAIALLFALLAAPHSARAEKLLRWKFQPEQKLLVRLEQKVDTEASFSNKPMKMSVEMQVEMSWHVGEVKDEIALVTQTVDRIVAKLNVPPTAPLEFDSTSTKKPTGDLKEIATSLSPLVGTSFVTRINARGQILDVDLPEKTSSAIANAGNVRFGQLFTAERIRQLISQATLVVPEQPINIGQQWHETKESEATVGKLRQKLSYTYDAEEPRDTATLDKIRIECELELVESTTKSAAQLKEQSTRGVIYFDNAVGRVVASELTQQLKTESKLRENTIQGSVSSSLKLTIKESVKK